jgi:hypothetical protein
MWLGDDDTVQGLGCPGTCMGADGNLYEWVEGVDGLGNPVGFWKRVRRGLRRIAPLAQRLAPLVPGGQYVQQATAAFAPPAAPQAPPVAPPGSAVPTEAPAPAMAGWGLGNVGDVAEGPDGHLYEWVQGVDGLGNPIGFWKRLKRGLRSIARRAMPLAQQFAPFVPGGAAALTAASPFLKQAGLVGTDGIGALYEAPDGSLYQVQGTGEDDALRGVGDEELQGLNEEELRGLEQDDELRGFGDDDELRGIAADDELRGLSDDEIQGMDGFVRDGVSGLEAFQQDMPRETPQFRGQGSPMWTPLW